MGEYMVGLVGEASYQPAIRTIARGHVVDLVHEPSNPYDPDAVKAVTTDGQTIGYLPREHWAGPIVRDGKPEHLAVVAEVTGGKGAKASRGVVLVLFTADEAKAARARAQPRSAAPMIGTGGAVIGGLIRFAAGVLKGRR